MPTEELPVKPFFFASVEFIEHFLFSREEGESFVLPASGESRPDGECAMEDDDAERARSGSSAAK